MAKFNVRTPAPGHTGPVGTVHFVDGKAEVDEEKNASELAYFRVQGYVVEEIDPPASKRRAPAKSKADDAKTGDDETKSGEKSAEDGRTASGEDPK